MSRLWRKFEKRPPTPHPPGSLPPVICCTLKPDLQSSLIWDLSGTGISGSFRPGSWGFEIKSPSPLINSCVHMFRNVLVFTCDLLISHLKLLYIFQWLQFNCCSADMVIQMEINQTEHVFCEWHTCEDEMWSLLGEVSLCSVTDWHWMIICCTSSCSCHVLLPWWPHLTPHKAVNLSSHLSVSSAHTHAHTEWDCVLNKVTVNSFEYNPPLHQHNTTQHKRDSLSPHRDRSDGWLKQRFPLWLSCSQFLVYLSRCPDMFFYLWDCPARHEHINVALFVFALKNHHTCLF